MTDQVITMPQTQSITKHVRKMPPETVRWLLELARNPPTPELLTVMEVNDEEFGLVVMSPGAWWEIRNVLHTLRSDRYRALFNDQDGKEGSRACGLTLR